MTYSLPYGASLDAIVFLANENRKEKIDRLPPTLRSVMDEILSLFHLEESNVICNSQAREKVIYRQLFSYAARAITGESLKRIGEFLGGYDHSTIITHIKNVKQWIKDEDNTFFPLWKYYSIESKIWNQ